MSFSHRDTESTEVKGMVNGMFHNTKNKIKELDFVFVSGNINHLLDE